MQEASSVSYKLEILPRYGTNLGVIWRIDSETGVEDVVGHVRFLSREDEERWKTMLGLKQEQGK